MLAGPVGAVVGRVHEPFQAAGGAVCAAAALLGGGDGGVAQVRHDLVVGPGGELGGGGEPARGVGFEGFFVVVAGVVFFADVFHDAAILEVVEEEGVEEALGSVFPGGVFGLWFC